MLNDHSSAINFSMADNIISNDSLFDLKSNLNISAHQQRGRGAHSNQSGRFEKQKHSSFDDGWDSLDELPPLQTEVHIEKAKTILTRNTSPDISFDRSINPYRGCEHGCVYCFARPSHAYMGLSPGLDFESKLFAKPNAAQLLEDELSKPGYRPRTIAIGTNTDPYQPIEKKQRIMRSILEVLKQSRHPVAIVTKSALITRDIDLLSDMAQDNLVKVAFSITTLDRKLARAMEPRAATPERRLTALRQLSEAGIPTAVMVAPIIPALNDMDIEKILDSAYTAGAREAGYILLRLPLEVRDIFRQWLLQTYPERYRHVMSILQCMRDGKDYDAKWHRRMHGNGPYAWVLGRRFELAAKRRGFRSQRRRLSTQYFQAPQLEGDQLVLL